MLIYLRPQVIAWREAVPDRGRWFAWRMAMCLQNPPPPRRNNSTKNKINFSHNTGAPGGISWQQNDNGEENGTNGNDTNVILERKSNTTQHSSTLAGDHSETNHEDDENPTLPTRDDTEPNGTVMYSEALSKNDNQVEEAHNDDSEPVPPQAQQEEERKPPPVIPHNDYDDDEDVEEASLSNARRSSRSELALLNEGIPLHNMDNLENGAAVVDRNIV